MNQAQLTKYGHRCSKDQASQAKNNLLQELEGDTGTSLQTT